MSGKSANPESLFAAAIEIDSHEGRAAFLEEACKNDPELFRDVAKLVADHFRAGQFLEKPVGVISTAHDEPPAEQPGTVIGSYKLIEEIGEGGMGTVYMAQQTEPVKRLVALKLIKPGMDSRQVIARFEAERQALALMDHPNIAHVFDAGTTATGRPYFVMELVKGVPLTKYCDEHRLTPAERLKLFIPVCQAIQHAHQKGIIHRDITASNVLVALYDGEPVPKVIDFGIAKATRSASGGLTDKTLVTGFGAVVGTPEYMSPEQAELNQLDIDTRSDIYSLGVLLYELLTGTTPLDRKRLKEAPMLEMLRVIREEEPPKPSTRLSTMEDSSSVASNRGLEPKRLSGLVRGELDWIVMKALEKDRKRRYETASGLANDLRRYLSNEPVSAGPPSSWYRLRKLARRNRAGMATAAIVAAALVAVAGISVIHATNQARATKRISGLATALGTERESLRNSLAQSNHLLAIRNFDRGQAAFGKGELGPGMLWMIESWRSAIDAGDPAWQHAARANLAAWQPHLPRLKAVLSHPSPVEAAAFSPDGKRIVTGSDDQTAQLWDAATARRVGPPLRHESKVNSVAFSPDGKTIVTGNTDKTARLWDAATGRPIGVTLPHQDEILAVAFTSDGKLFLTGSIDKTARLWDTATGQPIGSPFRHKDQLRAAAFSRDGKLLLTGSWDKTARLWDTATGQPVGSSMQHPAGVLSVAFSPDGKSLLTGCQDGATRRWDAATGQPIGSPEKRHLDRVRSVAFRPDGKTFLTASNDKTARLWDAATSQPIGRPVQHQGPVVAVAFHPDGKTFVTASSDGTARIWDADPYQLVKLVVEHRDGIRAGAFSADGKILLTASIDKTARLWDAATGRPLGSPLQHNDYVRCAAYSPDGKSILTGCRDKTARLWDAASGAPIGPAFLCQGEVEVVAFSPDGKTFLIGSQDRTLRLGHSATRTLLCPPLPQPGSVDAGVFSPDSKSFVLGYDIGTAQLWDVATRTPLGHPFLHPGDVNAVAFSPDGKTLVTGCEDGMARLWDVATRKLLVPPLVHQTWVWDAAFSPDGRSLLTASDDGTRLWDVATGMPLGPTLVPSSKAVVVAFSPDGKTILSGSADAKARIIRNAPVLPDDFERVATWVEVLTGLTLDPKQSSIQVLDNAAWRERREQLMQLGGPPETAPEL
jgi:WD40 repeat protein/serine/threonine protein kinase